YDDAWIREAESRGLCNLPATPDCVPCYLNEKNVKLFTAHRVYSPAELKARYEIKLDTYNKIVKIEAQTMVNMVWKDILPAVSTYSASLAEAALSKEALGAGVNTAFERATAAKLSELMRDTAERTEALRAANEKAKAEPEALVRARLYHDEVLVAMERLRESVDAMEVLCDREVWPYPTYGDILFSVK
ncbi:MAG TPA: glutamine synthetase type III, partial [Clostridiales bacterium]|nr:glutamine synthetase type III [Clostridiales bacterium]